MKFLVLDCENSTRWDPISFSDMFRHCLAESGDDWQSINIAKGEPFPEQLIAFSEGLLETIPFQGIIISGSHFNCRDRDSLPWFDVLCEFIRRSAVCGKPRVILNFPHLV
jgi:hypothetical protein